jgi:hypothetical protein
MQVQKKISVQGEWAKVRQDINDKDILTILNEGQITPGDYGDRNVFKLKTQNGEKILSFNQTSMNYLIDAFGNETKNWVGKEIKAWIIKINVSGKLKDVIYLTAPDWIMGSDGFIPSPDIKQDEIHPEEIPF